MLAVAQNEVVYEGQTAAEFKVSSSGTTWRIKWVPGEAVDTLAYRALSFAYHPGDARGTRVDTLRASVSGQGPVDLVRGKYAIDLARQEWQMVQIPLEALGVDHPIIQLALTGNLNGTFYIDDLRLVAAAPPVVTVVEEEHTAALPQAFALSQNAPTPSTAEP